MPSTPLRPTVTRRSVVAVQSMVSFGRVGNAAAVFLLNRLGHEAWPVPTVQFSNHPGHGGFEGWATPPDDLDRLLRGLDRVGALAGADAMLTGYLGDPGQGVPILDALTRFRAARADGLYLCDPVIGDHGRTFVKPGVAELIRDHLAPAADILTPNAYELGLLTGSAPHTAAELLAAARRLRAAGTRRERAVVATGLRPSDAPPGMLVTFAVEAEAAWRVDTPDLGGAFHGAGDAFAALFLAGRLSGLDTPAALGRAMAAITVILRATRAAGQAELELIGSQRDWAEASPVAVLPIT